MLSIIDYNIAEVWYKATKKYLLGL